MSFQRRKNEPCSLTADPYLSEYSAELCRRRENAEKQMARWAEKYGSLSKFASAHRYFGLHRHADKWVFREYAPNAREIFLVGDFSDWQCRDEYRLESHAHGVWEGVFPGDALCHLMHYKIMVHWDGGGGMRIPAYAGYVVQDEQSRLFSAVVWDPDKPYKFRNAVPPAVAPVIYESHPGMAQEEAKLGSFDEFRRLNLPEIAAKGYNTVQLMAVMEHPYYGSFGYHVANFFAVSSRFGTPDEFKQLVDEAHGLGLRVIMDIVHSHAVKNEAEGLAAIAGSRETYFSGEHPAWDSLLFDYRKDEVVRFLLSNCRYFLEEYKLDGFRFDGVTSMLYHHHGLNRCFTSYEDYFGSDVDEAALTYLTAANKLIHEIRPDALTVAEDVSGMPGLASAEGIGFDFRLAMGVTDMWFKLLDIPDEQWDMFQLYGELINRRRDEKSIGYVECHDQAIVGGQSAFFRMTDAEIYTRMHCNSGSMIVDRAVALHKMMRLATAAAAGNGYLNFMGNEFGHPEWVDLPREGNNWSMAHARRQWSLEKDPELRFSRLSAFDREITALIGTEGFYDVPVQTVRIDNEKKIIAFERNGNWFFFNFHPERAYIDYEIEVLRGSYVPVLDSDDPQFDGFARRASGQRYFSMPRNFGEVISLYLPPRTALVLTREF
jgi:1,4-alpha-glucan branching enzyme